MRCLKIQNTNISQSISYPVVPHTDIFFFVLSLIFFVAMYRSNNVFTVSFLTDASVISRSSISLLIFSLIQRWNPVLPLSPERHPYSSFNFQGSSIKSCTFCRYTFLYLFRFNAIISPVTANVNSTSCVLGSFLYSFLLIFCYLVL